MSAWIATALVAALIIVLLTKMRRRRSAQSTPPAMPSPSAAVNVAGHVTIGEAGLAPVRVGSLNDVLYLTYRDGGGKSTERRFTLHVADGHQTSAGVIALETMAGYCHLRHMSRTFRLDRVVSVADADGVVINNLGAWILARATG